MRIELKPGDKIAQSFTRAEITAQSVDMIWSCRRSKETAHSDLWPVERCDMPGPAANAHRVLVSYFEHRAFHTSLRHTARLGGFEVTRSVQDGAIDKRPAEQMQTLVLRVTEY